MNTKRDDIRARALQDLRRFEVVMEGHFDYGNGYHGRLYLNPHQLFRYPSTIWRVAQDLIDVLPAGVADTVTVVAGPMTGGALLAHTMAGLLDGRRPLTREPFSFAAIHQRGVGGALALSPFYTRVANGAKVLLVDDVRNTGQTFQHCADLIAAAGGTVVATAEIVDRCEAVVTLAAPNVSLVDYPAPDNHAAADCPLCRQGVPVSAF
ncbi:MAG TPA: phosphoribosyltransferase family protein [Vicinamibacterales bacterium]|nr:phosphoribosyltransferase family protein [Vicinamibacterales bacterium]